MSVLQDLPDSLKNSVLTRDAAKDITKAQNLINEIKEMVSKEISTKTGLDRSSANAITGVLFMLLIIVWKRSGGGKKVNIPYKTNADAVVSLVIAGVFSYLFLEKFMNIDAGIFPPDKLVDVKAKLDALKENYICIDCRIEDVEKLKPDPMKPDPMIVEVNLISLPDAIVMLRKEQDAVKKQYKELAEKYNNSITGSKKKIDINSIGGTCTTQKRKNCKDSAA
tara:strand:+ start:1867 stop:2535 length:669 start_codon:yes stop_codon:yes gene_type:complete